MLSFGQTQIQDTEDYFCITKTKKELVSAQQSNQTNNNPRVTFDNSRHQAHTDLFLTTTIFSAPAEYGSYSESLPSNLHPVA